MIKKFLLTIFLLLGAITPTFAANTYSTCPDGQGVCPVSIAENYLSCEETVEKTRFKFIRNEEGEIVSDGCENQQVAVTCGLLPTHVEIVNSAITGEVKLDSVDIEKACTPGTPLEEVMGSIDNNPGLSAYFLDGTGYMYTNPPVEPLTVYARRNLDDITEKINPIDSVNAQESTVYYPGLGYEILRPIQTIWSMNRNIAYGFLILIVIFIAMLILFRRQLNGQQAISLGNSLPSLIISLILITFSYPISGFFVDLISIGANFVQYVLVATPASPGYETIWNAEIINRESVTGAIDVDVPGFRGEDFEATDTDVAQGKYAVQIDDRFMSIWMIWGSSYPVINDDYDPSSDDPPPILNIVPDSVLADSGVIQSLVTGFLRLGLESDGGNIGMSVLSLIFSFAALMASVRLFFALLNAYLTLILFPAISPFIFLFAGIPSLTGQMISSFLKTMLSSALSFVAVYTLFLFMLVVAYEPLIQQFSFVPPLLGYSASDPLETGGTVVRSLIAFGLFLSAPMVPQIVKGALDVGSDSLGLGENIGKGFKQGAGMLMGIGGFAYGKYKQSLAPKD